MVLVKNESTTISIVADLSHYFNEIIMPIKRGYDEVIVVFNLYKDPVQYQINDDIRIISMKRFLSRGKIKTDLTDYLTMKVMLYIKDSSSHNLVVENNYHEKVDTLLIHRSVLASHRNPLNAKIVIFPSYIDILVLAIGNHHTFSNTHQF